MNNVNILKQVARILQVYKGPAIQLIHDKDISYTTGTGEEALDASSFGKLGDFCINKFGTSLYYKDATGWKCIVTGKQIGRAHV